MQGLKHNMPRSMCERAWKTAGNLDGDNDAEPIYAKHVTNMMKVPVLRMLVAPGTHVLY